MKCEVCKVVAPEDWLKAAGEGWMGLPSDEGFIYYCPKHQADGWSDITPLSKSGTSSEKPETPLTLKQLTFGL